MAVRPGNAVEPERKSKLRVGVGRAVAIGVLGLVGFAVWVFVFPHETKTDGPVALQQAKHCPIPLPQSARNIQFLKQSQWISYIEYVRFEAPPQDCLDHVKVVLDAWRKHADPSVYPDPDPMEIIKTPPYRDLVAEQAGVNWFDIDNIKRGVTRSGGSGVPAIWIDTERGIFYYRLTD
jgi:hypothetical protein